MKINFSSSNTSWRSVALEDLVEQHSGQWGLESPVPDAKEMLVLGVGNVTNEGQLDLEGATQRFFTTRDCDAIAEEGDLLVVKSSGSATNIRSGKTAICPPELSGRVACSNFMYRLSVKRHLAEPYLLWLILNSPMAKDFVRSVIGASTYPNIKWETYKAFRISLPPPDEQKLMAARLREQMAEVELARAAVQAQLDAAQSLPAALLRAIFTSPAAQRWPRHKLDELCEIVAKQVDPRDPEYGNLPHVSGENIVSGLCQLINIRTATEDGMISGKYLFEAGDVLYSKLRPYLRKVAIAESRGLCSADMYPLRVNPKFMDARFTAWMLLSEDFSGYAIEESQRSRMPKLNREQLFAYEAPVPPLAEQQKIGARLDAELTAARALEETLETRLAEIELLPSTLLRSAFNGEP